MTGVRPRPRRIPAFDLLETRSLMSDLFVSPAGDDAGAGTRESPWLTVGRALAAAVSGDVIVLRAGTYPGGIRVRTANITLRPFAGEHAAIVAPFDDEAIGAALWFDAPGGAIEDLEIAGGSYYTLKFEQGPGRVDRCTLHDSGRDVVKIVPGADDVVIRRSEIYNSGRRDPSNAEGIDDVNGDRLLVQDCSIHDIATNGIYAKGGATGCVIERNTIRHAGGGGILLGFYTDADWFDTAANPDFFENIDGVARNNLIVDTQYAGIGFFGALRPTAVHNTLVDTARAGHAAFWLRAGSIWISDDRTATPPVVDPTIVNNLVVQAAGTTTPVVGIKSYPEAPAVTGTLTIGPNAYFRPDGPISFEDTSAPFTWPFDKSLAAWQALGRDAGSFEADPGLDAEFRLAAGSPCIDAGAAAGVADDIEGQARTGIPDLGADEFGRPSGERIIDDGDPGFSTTGWPWTRTWGTAGYGGHSLYDSSRTGSWTTPWAALWTFDRLAPGNYEVYVTWVSGLYRATDAPYTVLDGPTELATVRVNQRQEPGDVAASGVTWRRLGIFGVRSGTLIVRLTDDADDTVLADAVRVVPVPLAEAGYGPGQG